MRIVKYELLKVCKNKFFLICLALLFTANLFYSINSVAIDSDNDRGIRIIYDSVKGLTEDETREYFAVLTGESSLTGSPVGLTLAKHEHGHFISVSGYTERIERRITAIDNLFGVSFFTKNNQYQNEIFHRDIDAYTKIKDRIIDYDVSYGVTTATENYFTNACILVLMLIISMYIISDEKDKGLNPLINATPRGRGSTIAAKTLTLTIGSVFITTLFFAANLFVGGFKYGICDLNQYIQSMSGFIYSVFDITVLQFLLLFLLTQILVVLVFSLLVSLVCTISKSNILSYGIIAVIMGLETALYFMVSPDSPMNFLHYINLLSAIQTNSLFKNSQYINLFGYPVNAWAGTIIGLAIIAAIVAIILYIRFSRQKSANWNALNLFARITGKLFKLKAFTTNMFLSELYRVFIKSRVLLIIITALLVQQTFIYFTPQKYDSDEVRYHQYILRYGGELTESKAKIIYKEIDYVKSLEEKKEELNNQFYSGEIDEGEYVNLLNRYDTDSAKLTAILRLEAQMDYLDKNNINYLVYETDFDNIFSKDSYYSDCVNGIFMAIVLILCVSQMFSNDSATGMNRLIRAAPLGRERIFIYRTIIASVIGVCSSLTVYIPYYLSVLSGTKPEDFTAAMNCLQVSGNSCSGSVFDNLLLLLSLRALYTILISITIMCISSISKNNIISLILNSTLTLIPLLFSLINAKLVEVGLNPFFSVNALREVSLVQIITTLVLLVLFIVFAFLHWQGKYSVTYRRRPS